MQNEILKRIQNLSEERESLLARGGEKEGLSPEEHERLHNIDHELQRLWDLRRRELAGEYVNPNEDYLDEYTAYGSEDANDK